MAGELWFYHLERSSLPEALGPLLEKSLQRGWRALVRGGEAGALAKLDDELWTWRADSFVPHAREGAGEGQPVWLTLGPDNPNDASVLFLVDGAAPGDLSGFERACLLFDGTDTGALEDARGHWKAAKAQGLAVSYWQEKARGKWEKQA